MWTDILWLIFYIACSWFAYKEIWQSAIKGRPYSYALNLLCFNILALAAAERVFNLWLA